MIFRKAKEEDRKEIALTIADAFYEEFLSLTKDKEAIAKSLESGINISCFFVAEDETILGVAGCADNTKRSVIANKKDCKKAYGFIKGLFAYRIFQEEFMRPLNYPSNIGFLEFVATKKEAQRKKIATNLLKFIVESKEYDEYILDVVEDNTKALECYKKIGFQEFSKEKVKHPKRLGYTAKIYLRYPK